MVAVAAPKRSGNIRVAPSPKVKAIGALVMTISPGAIRKCVFAKVSHGREDVAVELDAALGHAGRAAGEGDQRRIVAAGVDGRQRFESGAARLQLALAIVAVIFDEMLDEARLAHRAAEVADEAAVDDRVADLGARRSPSRSRRAGAAAWSSPPRRRP